MSIVKTLFGLLWAYVILVTIMRFAKIYQRIMPLLCYSEYFSLPG